MEFKYHRSKSVQSNTRYKTKESIDKNHYRQNQRYGNGTSN